MLGFLEVSSEQTKALWISAKLHQRFALSTCVYFLDWVATQANDSNELRRAVEALKRAVKETNGYRHQFCLELPA